VSRHVTPHRSGSELQNEMTEELCSRATKRTTGLVSVRDLQKMPDVTLPRQAYVLDQALVRSCSLTCEGWRGRRS